MEDGETPSAETREVGIESEKENEKRDRRERVEGDFKNNKKSSKTVW